MRLWRRGAIDDIELLRRLSACAQNHPGDGRVWLLTGQVHLERGDKTAALECLQLALKDNEIQRQAQQAVERAEQLEMDGVVQTFTERSGSLNSIDISPDRTRIITGCDDHGVILWNAESGEQIVSLIGIPARCAACGFCRMESTPCRTAREAEQCVRYWEFRKANL
jgi:WD40 repeat protein